VTVTVAATVTGRRCVMTVGDLVSLLWHRFCPWKSHLYDVEAELGVSGVPLFVVYADSGGMWRVQVSCLPS
jgi:hypothetical protein